MKKASFFTFVALLCVILQGCGQRGIAIQNDNSNIHILYNIDEVASINEATVYSAEPFRANEEKLCDIFLRNEIESETLDAMGRVYYTNSEAMIFYYREQEAGLYGGFLYSAPNAQDSENKWYQDVVVNDPECQFEDLRADYEKWVNLDLKNIEDVLDDIERITKESFLPKIQATEVYALDEKTMNKHASLRMDADKEDLQMDWSKEEEAYLIHYEQVVDGIPLMNHIWTEEVRSVATETPITVIYSGNGIVEFYGQGMVDKLQELEKYKLLSPEAAERSMCDSYKAVGQISEVEIEKMELKYVVLYQKERLILVPAYVFCVAINSTFEDSGTGETYLNRNYEHYVVNAISGERMVNASYEKNTFVVD